jgi:hypothetical protein
MENYDINQPWLSLDEWQKEYIYSPDVNQDNFLLTGRQSGKTTAMSLRAVELCIKHFKKGDFVLINSITEKQAFHMLNKARIYAETHYFKEIRKDKDNKPTLHRIMFKNGTGILCYAAGETGEGQRGFTIKKLMIDEGSRMSEEYFIASMPMLSVTKGSMDIASTPFGKKHKDGSLKFFYKCSLNEKFKKYYVSAEDCPRHEKEFLLEQKKRLSKLAYAQEYLAIFTDELKRIFDEDWIKAVCILDQKKIIINPKAKKYLGVDVAGFGKDLCTYEGVQKLINKDIEQIDHINEKKNYTTDTSKRIIKLNELRKYTGIGVDDGGIGFGVYSELMNNNKTKKITTALNNASRPTNSEGDRVKRLLKEEMYINLLALGENKRIKLFNLDEIIASLESMQYDENGKIFGSDSHIAEGIVRGVWLAEKDKSLKPYVYYKEHGSLY